MNRDIILLGGKPGSGKSRLGRELAAQLTPELSIEHMSLGEHVRAIGRGAISAYSHEVTAHFTSDYPEQPMEDTLVYDLVSEYLSQAKDTELILLDGYPRYLSQVEPIYELAIKDGRQLQGMIITDTSDDTALMRMLKRNKKDLERQEADPMLAKWRIQSYKSSFRSVHDELLERGLPIEIVNTSHDKQATTRHGLFAVAYMLSTSDVLE